MTLGDIDMKENPKLLFGLEKVPVGRETMDARYVPDPFRQQFIDAMRGQCKPSPEPTIFYTSDWIEWASGNWRWGDRPYV